MSLSGFDPDAVFDSWLESRVAAFEDALRRDPAARPDDFLADCPTPAHHSKLARELALIVAEHGQARGRPCHAFGEAPEEIGPFRIGRLLGEGGFGQVFEAWDSRLDRPVAIKLLRQSAGQWEAPGVTFLNEARAVARLRHPAIVVLFDVGDAGGRPFLVYERIEGTDLRQVLRHGPLPVDETLRIVEKVGQALAFAHDRGILHRDVKPSNILIDTDGKPFLTDFGLSVPSDPGQQPESPGTCGTLAYLAPELLAGKSGGVKADIYALGAVLYECLTGRALHAGPLRLRDSSQEPIDLPMISRPGLDRLVAKALARDPAGRFASVGDFLEALRAIQADRCPELANGTSNPAEFRPGPRSTLNRRRGLLASLTFGLLAIGPAYGLRQAEFSRSGPADGSRIVLEGSASMVRSLTEQERARAFRGVSGTGSPLTKPDYKSFFRTLLAAGDTLPKPFRGRILLECAGSCRNRGDLAGATSDLFEASALVESGLAETPDADDALRLRREIARAFAGWSDLPGIHFRRRISEAQIAVELGGRITGDAPPSAEQAYDRITLANLLRSHGEKSRAAGVYRQALAFCRNLPEASETAEQAAERLRQQYLLAQALRGIGSRAEAIEAYRLCGRAFASLPDSQRSSENWLDIEADRCFHQARLLREAGEASIALPLIDRAVGLWTDLAAKIRHISPETYDLPLAHSRNAKGAILADLNRPEEAIISFDESAGHYRSVLARNPDTINARRGLANVSHTSGRLNAESGFFEDAVKRFETAIEARKAITGDPRGTDSDMLDLAASWQALGMARLSTGQTAPGLEALRLSISMYRELEKVRLDDQSLRNRLAEAARALAENAATTDSAD
ncbi:protein kinase [bacterium]|nr:protein kinase [bacterium]